MPRLLPRSPDYGSGLDAGPDVADDDDAAVDVTLEGPWRAVAPVGEVFEPIRIVDGVRRIDAHALESLGDGGSAHSLFASYAVGAVHCAPGAARILGDEESDGGSVLRVRRVYIQGGGDPVDSVIDGGSAQLHYPALSLPAGSGPRDLIERLQQLMLDEESLLAGRLSADGDLLTMMDGPLRGRAPGPHVAGYIKRIQRWYLGDPERRLLSDIAVGERTPLFRIRSGTGESVRERWSWYLRLADLAPHMHELGGLARLELDGALPLAAAASLADRYVRALPRLASRPGRDPRAPQNLTPVGALESRLTRRMGDGELVRRLIARALHGAGGGERATVQTAAASPGIGS